MKKLHCLRIKFVDDDDDDNDDDELFFLYGCLTKGVKPYFQPAPLSEISHLPQLNFEPRTYAEPELRLLNESMHQ